MISGDEIQLGVSQSVERIISTEARSRHLIYNKT
jgi:hypothetical protein